MPFTGKIPDWPRERRLYPEIRSYGGSVAHYGGMQSAECLVDGDICLKETTLKRARARELGIELISQSEFFSILEAEKRLSAS